MSFYNLLRKSLEKKLSSKELELLPRGFQVIGDIILIRLNRRLIKRRKIIGRNISKIFPYIKSVFLEKNILTEFRMPSIELMAGLKDSETIHIEHGCKFSLNLRKVMFSHGNKFEKERMMKLCKPGETIIDMFAGIGYWTIPIAKHCHPKKIFAIDKNKVALEYLDKNCRLNKVSNKVEILHGDCKKFSEKLFGRADRIIMGWIFGTEKFLPAALQMASKRCTIHFHRICHPIGLARIKKKISIIGKNQKYKIKFLGEREVKTYSPRQRHYVIDLIISKS